MHKQEAIDALECYKRNTAHILGDNDEKVKHYRDLHNVGQRG